MRKKEAQQKGLRQSSLPASLERKDGVGGGGGELRSVMQPPDVAVSSSDSSKATVLMM